MSETDFRGIYLKQGYRLVGRYAHSAVKICQWTKESLRNNRVCYKELWYPPVQSHRCMMMTPYLGCNCHCLYCWRLHSGDRPGLRWKEFPLSVEKFDEPSDILDEAIEKRKLLLSGWKGNPKVDRKKFEESLKPTMMTMSLTGEPTLYPRTSELIEEAEKRGMITFLVTNGTMPEALKKLNPLPFQLYISVSAPNKKAYTKIVRPLIKDAWKRLNKTLELLPSIETRKVLRLTMIKGWNMSNHEEYAQLVKKAEPNYVELKAYEWVGESQKRLPKNAMPYMSDIEKFADKLSQLTGYEIKGKYKPSGAVLLA
ncbi:4-demethylwyosine synthase TYW1 [Candidatus Bathyarchaeota archaeon ex4484_231]|nr:MAG: 4-demethylwyosine synthase TYW1 [Candidatus Bathyarchaeota archaeon ex4484_231]RJS74806.1 MAG: 4-demethylwyosine synthase TYW1 [Candidatus Bathyarchaeota archaeon]